MIWHGRTSPAAHHGLVAGSSSAGPSPLKWPSPVHDLIARNVDFSLNNGPSATLRSCQLCARSRPSRRHAYGARYRPVADLGENWEPNVS